MSWSPVRGRSRSVASGWMSSAYLWSTCMVTMARPLSSSDPETWPTLIPAIVTVCPCPGVTAWAELNSALSSNLSSPMNGTQEGSRVVWEARMTPVVTIAVTSSTKIATKSRRCSRIARLMAPPAGSGGRRGRRVVDLGHRLGVAGNVHPERRRGDHPGLGRRREPGAGADGRVDVLREQGGVRDGRAGGLPAQGVGHPHELGPAAGLEANERTRCRRSPGSRRRAGRRRRRAPGCSAGRWRTGSRPRCRSGRCRPGPGSRTRSG